VSSSTSTDIISQSIVINARPETVYDVVSSPEHIAKWFADVVDWDAAEPVVGSHGTFVWVDETGTETNRVVVTVVTADRPRLFGFTWIAPERQRSDSADSAPVLVEFRITVEEAGTRLVVCESGLDAVEWNEQAKAAYAADHANGWGTFLPRLRDRAEEVAAGESA
jgi:uncharacterized protein YndB with AHSA1/START domain